MSGQQNVAQQIEVMELTANSQQQRLQHEAVLLDLEARRVAATIDVPTLPDQVRTALRELGCPVRLFGENLANVRDRLRMELARRQVAAGQGLAVKQEEERRQKLKEEEEEEVTKYTRASHELVQARQEIAAFSLQRAATRLNTERERRLMAVRKKRKAAEDDNGGSRDAKPNAVTDVDQACRKMYNALRKVTLEGSQYGDTRTLSCLCTSSNTTGSGNTDFPLVIATASWTGSIHLWDASSPALEQLGQQTMCHEDRIMGMDMMEMPENDIYVLATASIDLTGKLWKVQKADVVMADDTAKANDDDEESSIYTITEQAHLKGHAARLCRTAFHPMQKHVATTSFDHTWRLWDIETGQNLLLQDGHCRECYGIGFHPDGSLVATTDFASVVQLWDLRTGKAIHHFLGHAKRVLNAEFHPNGFQLASSGDDGTVKIWDLRRRKQAASLPAHSGLVTRLRFDSSGEYLASSSFDGSVKLWSCRDWKMLNQLQGHDGKVSGVGILPNNSIVSCGFDKTLKVWR